jgi:putative ABC transport system ATP-binding protein
MMEAAMVEPKVLVRTIDLVKVYKGDVRALDRVNLTIHQGEFLSVMGPSGSGKSTLLNMLGALDRPTAGEVYVAGEALVSRRDLDKFRSRTVGFVFQLHNLLPTLTTVENVEVPMREMHISRRERHDRALELLEDVDLADKAEQLPPRLSGGERQRVAIARAFANEPQLLLADEPTGNLDSTSGAEVMRIFRKLKQEHGMTILVVTHDPAVARSTDRVVVLRDGQIVRDEPIRDSYSEDLRDFKLSSLGQALLQGTIPEQVQGLGLERVMPGLQHVLTAI